MKMSAFSLLALSHLIDYIFPTLPLFVIDQSFLYIKYYFPTKTCVQGKFFEVQVSGGQIIKTRIHCYFLADRRVVQPPPGETNYHIFYLLLSGLSQEEKQKFGLAGKTVRDFRSLNHRQDMLEEQKQKFADWKSSLSILGISYQDVMQILVSCILLGNVQFQDQADFNVKISSSEEDLSCLCDHLGLSVPSLVEGLTLGTSSYKGETIRCPLDIKQVSDGMSCNCQGWL